MLAVMWSPALPAGETSVDRGREIAVNVCASCHVVGERDASRPILNPPAPSFAEIANRPESKSDALRHFVTTTHWDEKTLPLTMPNPALTAEQVRDVVAYLLSQRAK
jgi:mono/diheme cytochrome c family protein